MLDLTSMTAEQQEALFHVFEVTADNPLESMKMDFLLAALQFKEWVEKNATFNHDEFQLTPCQRISHPTPKYAVIIP